MDPKNNIPTFLNDLACFQSHPTSFTYTKFCSLLLAALQWKRMIDKIWYKNDFRAIHVQLQPETETGNAKYTII